MWQRGRSRVEKLIETGELERVPVSSEMANRLMTDATAHVKSAELCIGHDAAGALQLSYDAVRKFAAALLILQGLRATVSGGHIAVIDAVKAQFNEAGGMQVCGQLHQLRRRRNRSEYPDHRSAATTEQDAQHAISVATSMVDATHQIVNSGRLGEFE